VRGRSAKATYISRKDQRGARLSREESGKFSRKKGKGVWVSKKTKNSGESPHSRRVGEKEKNVRVKKLTTRPEKGDPGNFGKEA